MADKVYVYRGPSGRFVVSGKTFERNGVARELSDDEIEQLKASHPRHVFEPSSQESAVPAGSIAEVLEWVGDDPERAQQALDVERERSSPRSTLVSSLEQMVSGDPGTGTETEG